MKLKKLIVIILVFNLIGCGTGPNSQTPKPSIDACKVIKEINAAFCVNNLTGKEYEIPIESMDRYVAFSEDHYKLLLIYIKLLQRFTPRSVDKKLEAFNWIEEAHQWRVKEAINGRNP